MSGAGNIGQRCAKDGRAGWTWISVEGVGSPARHSWWVERLLALGRTLWNPNSKPRCAASGQRVSPRSGSSAADSDWLGTRGKAGFDPRKIDGLDDLMDLGLARRDGIGRFIEGAGLDGRGVSVYVGGGKSRNGKWRKPVIVARHFAPARPAPLGHAARVIPWEIAADEPLDARHPAVALAWMAEAMRAEGESEDAGMERCARQLARAMAGIESADGLHPDFARGISSCMWSDHAIGKIRKLAGPIAKARAEACALREDIEPGEAKRGARKALRL